MVVGGALRFISTIVNNVASKHPLILRKKSTYLKKVSNHVHEMLDILIENIYRLVFLVDAIQFIFWIEVRNLEFFF